MQKKYIAIKTYFFIQSFFLCVLIFFFFFGKKHAIADFSKKSCVFFSRVDEALCLLKPSLKIFKMLLQYFKEINAFLSFISILCAKILFDVGLRGPRAQASVFTSRKIKALVYLIQIISNSLARFWNLWIIENLKIQPSFKLIIRIKIKWVVNVMHRSMILLLQYQAFFYCPNSTL